MGKLSVDATVQVDEIDDSSAVVKSNINEIKLETSPIDLMIISVCAITAIRDCMLDCMPEILVDLLLTRMATGELNLDTLKESDMSREFLENCLKKEVDNG